MTEENISTIVCFKRGERDFRAGIACERNPYTLPGNRQEWFKGWLKAKKEDFLKAQT